MPVISTTRARQSPMPPPTTIATARSAIAPAVSDSAASTTVATRATAMPAMP